ncbi:hypothetical protein [Arenibaculum pallidiluteum]|uniref:hypothetical protein n=1 Tax=Arenibaculum pallidiluteum TaxID=2812559 RepID=UPI001A958D5C|nr:hypothetical protein [Arenibaculum pallidiluteum]
MNVGLRPYNGVFVFEPLLPVRPVQALQPRETVEEPVLDLDDETDADDDDLPPADPNRPRGWLVSEREFERVFDSARGRFEDVPRRKRPPASVPPLFGC